MRCRLLITLALLLSALPSAAREWYVDNIAGDDSYSGAQAVQQGHGGPLKRIRVALCLAGPGDRIIVRNTGDPYREELSISGRCLHGFKDQPLVIDGGGATLDGSVTAATGAWRHVTGDLYALRPRRLTYQQLFKSGQPLTRVLLASAVGAESELKPLHWAFAEGQILVRTETDRLPESYEFRHAGLQTGITLYNTHHVRIENFIIQGFQQEGASAVELVRDCELRNIELRANGRSGLSVGGSSRLRVSDSLSYDNGVSQIRVEGTAHLALDHCEIDRKAPLPFDVTGGQLTIDGEPYPGFVSP